MADELDLEWAAEQMVARSSATRCRHVLDGDGLGVTVDLSRGASFCVLCVEEFEGRLPALTDGCCDLCRAKVEGWFAVPGCFPEPAVLTLVEAACGDKSVRGYLCPLCACFAREASR